MEQLNITLTFDAKRLEAMEYFLQKEKSTVQKRMEEALQQLYEQTVPEVMREFLDDKACAAAKPKRPSRSAPKPRPQTEAPSPSAPAEKNITEKEMEAAHETAEVRTLA